MLDRLPPWRHGMAGAPVLALRVTYVGEPGWELHVPVEFAATIYDVLTEAGAPHGLVDAGYRAIDSLRLEKPAAPGAPTSAPTTRP
jgi:sarcosine dehydrogenase